MSMNLKHFVAVLLLCTSVSMTAHAGETEVQTLTRANYTALSRSVTYEPVNRLAVEGTLASGKVSYRIKGTKVYFAVTGSQDYVLASQGVYDIGDEQFLLVGRDSVLLDASFQPVESISDAHALRKRPGRAKVSK